MGFSTAGASNVSLSFTWNSATATGATTLLEAVWRVQGTTTWNVLTSVGANLGAGNFAFQSVTVFLPAAALGTFIDFGFQGQNLVGENTFRIDNVVLQTPEPGTIALFGTTLLGLGWRLRRKRTKAAAS